MREVIFKNVHAGQIFNVHGQRYRKQEPEVSTSTGVLRNAVTVVKGVQVTFHDQQWCFVEPVTFGELGVGDVFLNPDDFPGRNESVLNCLRKKISETHAISLYEIPFAETEEVIPYEDQAEVS